MGDDLYEVIEIRTGKRPDSGEGAWTEDEQDEVERVVERLNRELVKVLGSQDVKDQFAQHSAEASPSTPEEFGAYVKQEIARWQKVARDAGVKPE